MNFKLFAISFRNVSRNKRRSLVTMVAIFFGLFVVVVIKSFADGFIRMTIENVVNAKIGALQIHKKGYMDNIAGNPLTFHFPYTEQLLSKVRSVPGVKAVTGRIVFSGNVTNGRSQAQFFSNAIDVEKEISVCPQANFYLEPGGQQLKAGEVNVAIVGSELAKNMKADLQTLLTLSGVSPRGKQNAIDVKIHGLSRSALHIEEKRALSVPLKLAQDLLDLKGEVTELAVSILDLKDLDTVVESLKIKLGDDYEVHNWQEIQPFFRDIIARQRIMIGLVSFVLVVLVFFLIANTMLMSVFERVREIGTMLSVGVKQFQVLQIFLGEALALGFIGSCFGAVVASVVVILLDIYGIKFGSPSGFSSGEIHTEFHLGFVLMAILFACVCAMLSGLYPALKASKLDPVEALRST